MKKKSFLKKLLSVVGVAMVVSLFPQTQVMAAVPAAPTSLIAIVVNGGQVDLDWTDNSVDELGFNVERAPDIGGLRAGTYVHIGSTPTVPANTVTYSDTTVSAVTAYWYRVAAVNADGSSFYSNAVRVLTPHSAPQISLVTPTPPTATLQGGQNNLIEAAVTAPGAAVASAEYQLVMDNATGVFDAHDVLNPQLDLTILAPRAASPVADTTPMPSGLPAGAIAEFEIRGTVASVDAVNGVWQIGSPAMTVYESVTGQPQSTVFVGSRHPIANDAVKIIAYRTVASGPLVAKSITYIAPAAPMGAPANILSFLYNGAVSAMQAPMSAPGYLVAGEVWTVGSGSFRVDAPDFPAYISQAIGVSTNVTVRFASPRTESNIARGIFNQISPSIQNPIDSHPIFDNTPVPQNYPPGTWLYIIVDGVVSGHDVVNGTWTIGTEGIKCYESAQTLVAPATIGDEVLVYCRRTLTPGPLIAQQIYNILPGPLAQPYKETAVEVHLMYNGVIQTMGPNTWTVGGQTFTVDDPEGKARIDSSPFPAFAIGNPVTVEFDHVGEVIPDNASWAPLSLNGSTGNWDTNVNLPAVLAEKTGRLFLRVTDSLQSGSTTTVSSILQVVPTVPPADPTGLNATVFSGTQVDLTWTDNSTDESGFRIERAPDVGGNPGAWATLTTTGPNVVSFSDTTVAPNTTYHYRVFAMNAAGDSAASNVAMVTTNPPPTNIGFSTPSRAVNVNLPSTVITIQAQDPSSAAANVAADTLVTLTSSSGTGLFDTSAAGPFDGSITSVTIPTGASSISFYYMDSAIGTPTITAAAAGLTSGQQVEIVVAAGAATDIAFTTAPQTFDALTVSGPITLQTQDGSGAAANVAANTVVTLSSSSGTGLFDTSAAGPFDGSITSVTIPAGSNSATVYYMDSAAGTPAITATATGLNSGSQTETISPAVATQLEFTTQPAGAAPGVAFSVQPVVAIKDASGNVVASATDAVTIAITSGTGNTSAVLSGTTTVNAVAGIATFTDLSIDLSGYSYMLDATAAGLSSATSNAFNAVAGAQSMDLALSAGWNLISMPLIPADNSRAAVFSGISGNIISAWAYNAATLTWTSWSPAIGGDLLTVVDGRGYWVNTSASVTLSVSGQSLPNPPSLPPTYSMVPGWNLLGFKEMAASSPLTYMTGTDFRYPIYGFNNGAYITISSSANNMLPGLGYWVYFNAAGIITP